MRIRRRATAWRPAVLWMAVIFYLSAQSQPLRQEPSPALSYVAHFSEYALLASLLFWAQLATGSRKGKTQLALAVSFVVSVLHGASDEYHQSFVPGRDASVLDFATDALGAAFALAVTGRWGQSFLWRRDG